jgi:hypothetical protein
MREAMRWPIGAAENPLRNSFFETMAQLCTEWITREANLFLPTSNDPRVNRALDYTTQRVDRSSAQVIGEPPDRGVTISRARPTMRMSPPRPFGQETSMLELRRADPGTRTGAGPAEHLGGVERASFITMPAPL